MATSSGTIAVWAKVKLGDHVDMLTGYPFKSAEYSQDTSDIRLLRGDNVAQGELRWDGVKRWPIDKAADFRRYELHDGDVVLAMDRPWIEAGLKYAWMKKSDLPALLVQRVARLRGEHSLLTPYIRYLIGSPAFTAHVHSITTGTAVPHISGGDIGAFEFALPPLHIQRKIIDILSAYDDLIENNTRRIAILEEMAQALYREWFVEFRFPGHFGSQMVESELGPIPEGWRTARLDEFAAVNALSLKKGTEPQQIEYVDISSVSQGRIENIESLDFAEAPGRARRIVGHGDVIWSMVRPNRRSYSLILNPSPNLIVSTGFAVITARQIPFTYLYLALTTNEFVGYLTNHARGAAYPAVTAEDFQNARLVLPENMLMTRFHRAVVDMFEERENLTVRNILLRRTRDLLLPRLVSGEVDVHRLEIGEQNCGVLA